jgi:RHS repeat-associated protein
MKLIYYNQHTTYWQHSDHLGSASWITDTAGRAIQHLQYMPWGEPLLDYRNSSFNTRYTFSGKERDEETGYSYFGARYYNSSYSIWMSVDPMSDKYPSLSPYAYCGNNPVKLVDPNGREIWILGEDGQKYQYKNRALVDRHGIEVTPAAGSYEATVLSDLKVLANSKDERIKSRLTHLETSNHKHVIQDSKSLSPNMNACLYNNKEQASTHGVGCGSTIFFNDNNKYAYPDGADSYSPAALAHELIGHAYDNDCGNRTDAVSEQNSIPLIEISSINIQNIILKEHKLNERTQYGFDNGRRWVDIPKDLLNTFFTPNRKQ